MNSNSLNLVPIIMANEPGEGWYTRHGIKDLIFEPLIVDILETSTEETKYEDALTIEEYCCSMYGEDYYGDTTILKLVYLQEGTSFNIGYINGVETLTKGDILACQQKELY